MFRQSKEYPILEKKTEGRFLILVAGRRWTDEQRRMRFEGFELPLPEEVTEKKILFVISSVERFDDSFRLRLHSFYDKPTDDAYLITAAAGIDEDGDVWSQIILSREMLATLTDLSPRAVDEAFASISYKWTYDLLACMPRTISVRKDAVEVTYGAAPTTGNENVCSQLSVGKHPLDRT